LLINESKDKVEKLREVKYKDKESIRKDKASNNELIKLNKDISLVIDFLKEYIFSIINTLRALI
jgi:hypothetical protein